LETCCGYGYGLTGKYITHPDFQGATRMHLTLQNPQCFTGATTLSRYNNFPGYSLLTKKRELFQGLLPPSPSSFALPLYLLLRDISQVRFGNINPIPFCSRGLHHMINALSVHYDTLINVCVYILPLLRTELPDRLGPTDPCSTAVHMEPFSTSVFKVLT